MYSLLLALIYLAFISLGLPDSLLGAGWSVMHSDFGVPVSCMGIVSMIIMGSTTFSSLMSERLLKKFHAKIITASSVILTAVALFGFSLSTEFWMVCLWAIPYGLGAGAIDSALNNYIALHYTSRHMSWLHCFWGVGTIVSPYVMSFALTKSTWSTGYRIVSVIQFSIALVLILTLPVWKINQKKEQDDPKTDKVLGIGGTLKIKGVVFVLIAFFFYCTVETTTMLWASSYLIEVRNISEPVAAALASLTYIGITVGRFLSGFVSNKLGDKNMIRVGGCIAFFGVILILVPTVDALTFAGFVTVGFGCAPIYPSMIHLTPDAFGKENSQAIIGIEMASAYTGSTFMPMIFGIVAGKIGLGILAPYLMVFIIALILMIEISHKKSQNKNNEKDLV